MVVIVIVGILAAVAIPKFTKASHKAKASEFPTVLMQFYTAEIAYEAETGQYSDETAIGIDLTSSQWFSYEVTTTDAWVSTFTATAEVVQSFGGLLADGSVEATIDQAGAKVCNAGLLVYASSWHD